MTSPVGGSSGPIGAKTTNSVRFNAPGYTSNSISLVTPRRLGRLTAFPGGSAESTVSGACDGQSMVKLTVAPTKGHACHQLAWNLYHSEQRQVERQGHHLRLHDARRRTPRAPPRLHSRSALPLKVWRTSS